MLSHEVVDAAREGRFDVCSARTVDEGIALLTGIPAARRLERWASMGRDRTNDAR